MIGFGASRAHWLDVGAKDPGSPMDSTDIWQEGDTISFRSRVPAREIGAAGFSRSAGSWIAPRGVRRERSLRTPPFATHGMDADCARGGCPARAPSPR